MAARRRARKHPRSGRTAVAGVGVIEAPDTPLTADGERLFTRIAEEVMHGDRELFDELTPHEKQLVLEWLADAVAEGDAENAMHDVLWEIDYNQRPATIQEFIHDDHYLGRSAAELHPKWKEDLYTIFNPGSQIFEWVLTGGIGIGKTTLACVAQCYKLHCLSCLRQPARYYGLLHDSQIVFGIYSITKNQVADAGYFKLRGFIDNSPYFRIKFPRSRKIDSKLVFTRSNVVVVPGSQEMHALGLDMFAFMMDEVNFMRAKESKETGRMVGQAYDIYNATHTRLMSRFMRPGGTIPGMMILMSSRNSETSFLEEHLKKAESKYTYVSDYALWEVKPKHLFRKQWFKVEVGDRTTRSRVLREDELERKGARTVEIPGEFKKRFDEDVDQALRDVAGVATFNLSPLVRDRRSIFDAHCEKMRHPFKRDVVTVDIDDDTRLDEFFELKTACRVQASRWVPRINPNAPRFLHVDIALTGDCLGIAMGHVAGIVRNARINEDGTTSEEPNPYIVMDMMLRVAPPPGSEIDLSKIRSFIVYLSKLYPIAKITFDQFQSADSIQILKKLGFDTGHQSVDRKDEAYLMMRSAFFDRRILTYEYGPFEDEALDLERDVKKRKVDHPLRSSKGGKGSKDVSDGVAGVVWLCMTDPRGRDNPAILQIERAEADDPGAILTRERVVGPDTIETHRVAGTKSTWDDLRGNLAGPE